MSVDKSQAVGGFSADWSLSRRRLSSSTSAENVVGFCSISIFAINSFNRWFLSTWVCMALPSADAAHASLAWLFAALPSRAFVLRAGAVFTPGSIAVTPTSDSTSGCRELPLVVVGRGLKRFLLLSLPSAQRIQQIRCFLIAAMGTFHYELLRLL